MIASPLPRATRELLDQVEANVPHDLLGEHRWVAWDRTPRRDGQPCKTPLNPKSGRKAKSNDPQTWATFAEARNVALRTDRAGGVGVVLTGGPWLAVDFDHVIDLETGELAPAASKLLNALQPTYTELSPGGDGLHVWFRGQKPAGWTSQVAAAFGPRTKLETYDGSTGRYFTMTGNVWIDAPIADASEADIEAIGTFMTRPKRKASTAATKPSRNGYHADDLAKARFVLDNVLTDPDAFEHAEWLRLVMACCSLGDEGRQLAESWCARGAKYDPRKDATERHAAGFNGAVKIATLFYTADQAAPEWRQRWSETRPEWPEPFASAKKGDAKAPAEPVIPQLVAVRSWPTSLSSHVRHSLVGEFLRIVEEETEADPAAVVVDLLVRVGNAVGRGPHFEVGGDRHGCNLNAIIVGDTGQGRKGTSAAYPRLAMSNADEGWSRSRCLNGLSSGEGVIWAVRDPGPSGKTTKNGEPVIDPGVDDKRLLVVETELARTLRAAGRKGSTLTSILRQAWEGGHLAVMTKSPYAATGAHVSLLAHITETELRALLGSDDLHGGTANRFLFVCSRRQRELPFGGEIDSLAFAHFGRKLREAIAHGKKLGLLRFSALAREVWPAVYKGLLVDERATGLRGALLARAVAQVRRLAMVFAILAKARAVDVPHLDAALEVWRYCRDSVTYIFGSATGNIVADRLLGELRGKPEGMNKTDMHKLFDRHVTAQAINEALQQLHEQHLAEGLHIPTNGRPREVWRSCELRSSEESGEGSASRHRGRRSP